MTLVQDLRFALRVLRKSPSFTIAAVLTLAMAIGANAVVFSVLNGLILRPLNVPQAESLYLIERASDKDTSQSYPDYLDLRDRNHSFDGLASYSITQVAMNTGEGPSLIWGIESSSNYFDALRIQPYLGRFFNLSDEHGPNSDPYIVLSYAYWHSHFHDDRGVVGRTIQLNKHPFTILGVAPPEFRGTIVFVSPNFFVPMVNHEQVDGTNDLNDRGSRWVFMVVGHLKAGVSLAEATTDLNSIGSYLEKTYPKDERHAGFSLARPNLLGDQFAPGVRAFIAGLMLLAGLILLAACANLGSLFTARAADRSREVALRLALGSSRKRILCGLFTEAVLVSLVGIEKVVPRLADLAVMLKLLARSATGQPCTIYTNIFGGPRAAGEKDGPYRSSARPVFGGGLVWKSGRCSAEAYGRAEDSGLHCAQIQRAADCARFRRRRLLRQRGRPSQDGDIGPDHPTRPRLRPVRHEPRRRLSRQHRGADAGAARDRHARPAQPAAACARRPLLR